MKTKAFLTVTIALAFVVMAQAAPKKVAPEKPAAEKKDTSFSFIGEVVKVSATALILKGAEGSEDRSFAFTETTKIVNGEKPAKLGDIKVGNKVGGQARKAGKSDPIVLSVNVSVKEKADPKKPDAPKKKAA